MGRKHRTPPHRHRTAEERERWWRQQALRALGASHLEALKAAEDAESYSALKRTLLFPEPLDEPKG